MDHPYTIDRLEPGSAAAVVRVPGAREVTRLFPEPSSIGRGSLRVEGGITLVAGPGMGKTTLLGEVARALEAERGMPVARISLPPAVAGGEAGFHGALGALVARAVAALRGSPPLGRPEFAAAREALAAPERDGGAAGPSLTPRGLERWVTRLGAAAGRAGGVCLLVDDVDLAAATDWKVAFVGALRFAFQASAGVTPIYAAWRLYIDESLPGSNYFRNVTHPIFLEPLAGSHRAAGLPDARRALAARGLPGLDDGALARISALVGGHPQLLQCLLGDLAASAGARGIAPGAIRGSDVDRLLEGPPRERQRALAARLIADSADLAATLRELALPGRAYPTQHLSKVIVASGLVDADAAGLARVPERVREALGSPVEAP